MGTVRFLLARLIPVLAVVGAVVVAAPGTATAGGPTSVLLASPYTDSATGLYYADDDYTTLQTLIGGADVPAGSTEPPAAAGAPYVTATWLIHDVYVWRIDRIFLIGDDVWIVSEMSVDGAPLTGDGMSPGQTGDAGAVWHRPTDPAALTALLTAHGLTPGSARPTGAGSLTNGSPAGAALTNAALADTASGDEAPASTAAPSPLGWLWGIGGLVIGLLLGGMLVRMAMTRAGSGGPAAGPEPARMQPIG